MHGYERGLVFRGVERIRRRRKELGGMSRIMWSSALKLIDGVEP